MTVDMDAYACFRRKWLWWSFWANFIAGVCCCFLNRVVNESFCNKKKNKVWVRVYDAIYATATLTHFYCARIWRENFNETCLTATCVKFVQCISKFMQIYIIYNTSAAPARCRDKNYNNLILFLSLSHICFFFFEIFFAKNVYL